MRVAGTTSLTWNLGSDVVGLFQFRFMENAFVAGTIVAVLAGVTGWFMVLRRESFAGHTLAVVGFPGAAGATLVGVPIALGYFAFCVGSAIVIGVGERGARGRPIRASSATIGTVQAFALALGVLFTALYHGFLSGIDGLLFGDFLGVTSAEVVILAAVACAVLGVLGTIARPLLFSSVDADVAAARGVPTRMLNVAFLVVLGACVAEVSEITGSLLVFALLVMPAATAHQCTTRPAAGIALSIGVGLIVTWLGLAAAYYSPWPVGFYLTTFAFAAYLLASVGAAAHAYRGRRTLVVVRSS